MRVDGAVAEPSDFQGLSTGVCHKPPLGTISPFHRVRLLDSVHLLSQGLLGSSMRELGEEISEGCSPCEYHRNLWSLTEKWRLESTSHGDLQLRLGTKLARKEISKRKRERKGRHWILLDRVLAMDQLYQMQAQESPKGMKASQVLLLTLRKSRGWRNVEKRQTLTFFFRGSG